MQKAVDIVKVVLAQEMVKMELVPDVDRMVFRGGQDPGGWSNGYSLACVIHEGSGLPNDYNHPNPLKWWDDVSDAVGKLLGEKVYFEWINGCVAALYKV